MNIKLVDVDNKYREKKRRGKRFPNLALRKVSAYHKAKGDLVGFDIERPDLTYISCVFTKNRLKEMGAMPYVMPWEGGTPLVKALARWGNRRRLRNTPFWQYDRMPRCSAPIGGCKEER